MRAKALLTGVLMAVAALDLAARPQAQSASRRVERPAAAPAAGAEDAAPKYAAVITQYCAGCHNGRANTSATASGVVFDTVDLQNVAGKAALWEKVVRKLRAGAMPPVGMPHPDVPTQAAMLAWLEQRLDAAAVTPNPGRAVLHRLNRTEYRNVVRDLLAVDTGDI